MKHLIFILILGAFLLSHKSPAQWSQPVLLSTGAMSASLNENSGPCLAVSNDTLHVVWSDQRTNGRAIYYTRSADTGAAWNNPAPLTDTTGNATFPAIAVSGKTVHVVWMVEGNPRSSWYRRSSDGGNTWATPFCLDNTTAFWPGIACSGDTVVATLNKDAGSGNSEVYIMISHDRGANWGTEIRISNASGRSEDPAIAVKGSDIYLSWNDNRTGTMQIYYRRSTDGGLSWGAETQLTNATTSEMCYTSMVSVNGAHVDVPFGYRISNIYHVWITQSADNGAAFSPPVQLTSGTTGGEVYPYLVRDGTRLHLSYVALVSGMGGWYMHSDNGGASWDSSFFFGAGFQPFLAYTGCKVHVIYPSSLQIWYRVNPTINCFPTVVRENKAAPARVSVQPNPFRDRAVIKIFSGGIPEEGELIIYNVFGKEISGYSVIIPGETTISGKDMPSGIYFYRLFVKDRIVATGKLMKEQLNSL